VKQLVIACWMMQLLHCYLQIHALRTMIHNQLFLYAKQFGK
jgi:hypothetical protein